MGVGPQGWEYDHTTLLGLYCVVFSGELCARITVIQIEQIADISGAAISVRHIHVQFELVQLLSLIHI